MSLKTFKQSGQTAMMPKHSSGSAMVEFAMLLGVLLPVGLGVAMLGKLSDLTQTTEQASRYAAWEATVYSRNALASRSSAVEARFYGHPETQISSNTNNNSQVNDQGNDQQRVNPLWGRPATYQGTLRGLSSVSRDSQQRVLPSYEFDSGAAQIGNVIGSAVTSTANQLSGFSGNSWGLPGDGLLRSGVEVAVEPTSLLRGTQGRCGVSAADSEEQNAPRVCIRSTGVILADGWSASGDAQAASRVRSLVPTSIMSNVGEALSGLLGNTFFPELDPLDDAFGYVNMGVLPEYAQP